MVSFNVPRREGLFNINVNQEVELTLSYYNFNKFGKKQFSGFIEGKFYYLPTHQQLVDKLEKVQRGSKVKVKRLTLGNAKEACLYDVEVVEGPTGVTIKEEPTVDASQVLNTVVSCLKNNCSAGQTVMILKKEFDEELLKEIGL
jgi:hypothetical protein